MPVIVATRDAAAAGGPCLACGDAAGFQRIFAALDRCRACGFVSYRQPIAHDLGDLYDEAYFTGKEYPDYIGQQDALRRSMRRHLAQMRRYAAPGRALLEIGCAYGLFLDEARAHYGRVIGVDVSAEPVRYARHVLGVDARVGDLLTMDFDGARFDAICLWDTIEHLPAPDAFLARVGELLAPGGTVFLTTGDIGALNARVRGAGWRQIHPPTHLQYFSRGTIRRFLARLRLAVVGIETAAYYHTLFNILASLRLRGGVAGRASAAIIRTIGEARTRRLGLWVDLRDIMFVAARRDSSA